MIQNFFALSSLGLVILTAYLEYKLQSLKDKMELLKVQHLTLLTNAQESALKITQEKEALERDRLSRGQSVELKEFLADLSSGNALVAVARVDPSNILYRSPKKQ